MIKKLKSWGILGIVAFVLIIRFINIDFLAYIFVSHILPIILYTIGVGILGYLYRKLG